MSKLAIESGAVRIELEVGDGPTAKALIAAAPFESRAQTWGEEVYFSTPVSAQLEPGAKQEVAPGTVCFWTDGDAIALPWGRTPISTSEQPKLASPCTVLGKVVGDFLALKNIKSGAKIKVEKI